MSMTLEQLNAWLDSTWSKKVSIIESSVNPTSAPAIGFEFWFNNTTKKIFHYDHNSSSWVEGLSGQSNVNRDIFETLDASRSNTIHIPIIYETIADSDGSYIVFKNE